MNQLSENEIILREAHALRARYIRTTAFRLWRWISARITHRTPTAGTLVHR